MRKTLYAIALVVLLSACNKGGDEFLGKWVSVKWKEYKLEIVQNGDNFLVKETRPNFVDGKLQNINKPATIKDGILSTGAGLDQNTMAVDKKTGHLVNGNTEFERIKE